ncbi:MAG: DUF5343 domain-containing protein [Alphaproteobacteria bacterium]
MANKYPYVASAGPLVKTIEHLRRRSFPKELTAETLRKLGVAPKNESYVINVLRFLGVIDDEGKKVDDTANAFVQHKDEEFQKQFESLVRNAYAELFELHGDDAWTMDRTGLAQFFRTADHSTEIVGTRQAGTFTYLAALSGHTVLPQVREASARKATTKKSGGAAVPKAAAVYAAAQTHATTAEHPPEPRVGLTVRIEVNLPADGDQKTYDEIFRSIRKNLIDGE